MALQEDRVESIDGRSALGELLGSFRTARGWSQGRLAQQAQLDPSFVSRLEAGTRAPERETVNRLADALSGAPCVRGSGVCFEGTGLRATIVRSVVTGLSLLSSFPFPHKVFGSLTEGVAFVNERLDAAGAPMIQTAKVVSEIERWRTGLT